jgi:hypothetical protein
MNDDVIYYPVHDDTCEARMQPIVEEIRAMRQALDEIRLWRAKLIGIMIAFGLLSTSVGAISSTVAIMQFLHK